MPDLRVLIPAVGAWLAAWLAVAAPDAGLPSWTGAAACWCAAGTTLAVLLAALRRHRAFPRTGEEASRATGVVGTAATALVTLAASGLVTSAAFAGLEARATSPLADAAAEHRTVDVVVELTGAPRVARTPWFDDAEDPPLSVEGRADGVDGRTVRAVPVVLTVSAPPESLHLGVRLLLRARVTALPAEDGSAYRLQSTGEVSVAAAPPWLAWTAALRNGFADTAADLGGDGGALVPGLAIGDTSAVGAELDAAMKASSLSHLTAVSGANCAIVTAAAFALAAALGMPRVLRVAVALGALGGFIMLVTPEASVVRAAAMAVVMLIAIAAGRPGGGASALSVAIIVLLAVDPWYARDYGFTLSVCATAGLLLLARPLTGLLSRVMPVPLAVVLGVPLAAQLACQPVLVLLDPGLALYGVPANLLAAPAAPVATIVGLIGCLLLPLLPSVGFACLQLAWVPASWIALVAHAAAALPFGTVPWLPDAPGAALLAACTALGLWLALTHRRMPRARAAASVALLIAIAVPFGILVGAPAIGSATRPADWSIAMCDVGQGDAVFVQSEGRIALIDTGREPAPLERCRAFLGIERVDLLVLTHWDADHIGGVEAVVGRVATVIHGPLDGRPSSRVMDPLVGAGADAVEVTQGDHGTLGAARWTVVWPKPGIPPGNDGCVVLAVVAPDYTGAFLCDLGEDSQERVLATGDIDEVDLVKVAHHGSADQSARIYEQLDAAIGIIGVGAENGYGHPTDRLLDILARVGTTAVRTDLSGTILLTADGDGGFRLWSEHAGNAVGGGP